ncbi:MAG: C40 family peptidase [Cocleimonas sp.]|nr:C40 family peptidase [Cocleimonas sp.]
MKSKHPLLAVMVVMTILAGCTPPQRYMQPIIPSHPFAAHHSIQRPPAPTQRQTLPPTKRHTLPHQQLSTVTQTRERIVTLAHQSLGTRYTYGGSTPKEGFDCSGLMNYLHKKGANITIPRTAAQQSKHSQTVKYADLQQGDLLFFKTSAKSNHVGIYIGKRQFIHAPNRRSKVKITTMDNAYWHSKFVKFGTFLGR